MSKASWLKFAIAIVAAVVPVVVATFPGLPPVLVALLNMVAMLKAGDVLHKLPSPESK